MSIPPQTIFLIPVYNEEANLEPLLEELREVFPSVPVCFINDCSLDNSERVLKTLDCDFISLPCNLGVGGAMQAGFRYAYSEGFQYAIRIDGDGQHPPSESVKLVERMLVGDIDMVTGSRFLGAPSYTSSWYRQVGIFGLAAMLSAACRQKITDPTSGFEMVNRAVMYYFANHYPADYPEPESLALLSRQGYRFCEVGARFRARERGCSSIHHWGALCFLFKVSVALFVDRCRAVDPRFERQRLEDEL
jgi:glycosyltransferase involved in cell wall biosynthesis